MSLAGTMATASDLIMDSFVFAFGFAGATRELFPRGFRLSSFSSSETYEGLIGVEAMRAEDREGGRGLSSFRFFDGGLLVASRELADGVR